MSPHRLASLTSLHLLATAIAALCGCSSPSAVAVESDGSHSAPPAHDAASDRDVVPGDAGAPDAAPGDRAEVSVQGSVKGRPFVARGAAAREFGWLTGTGDPGPGISFAIGEYPAMCTAACETGAAVLHFYLRGEGKAFEPFPVGTYPIVESGVLGGGGPAPQGTVLTAQLLLGGDFAYPGFTTGSVTISASSRSAVTGTFDVTSSSSGRLTGSFVVPICPLAASSRCSSDVPATRSVVCAL